MYAQVHVASMAGSLISTAYWPVIRNVYFSLYTREAEITVEKPQSVAVYTAGTIMRWVFFYLTKLKSALIVANN